MYSGVFTTRFVDEDFRDLLMKFPGVKIFVEMAYLTSKSKSLHMFLRVENLRPKGFKFFLNRALKEIDFIKELKILEVTGNGYSVYLKKERCELLPLIWECGCSIIMPYKIFYSRERDDYFRTFTVVSPLSSAIKDVRRTLESKGIIEKVRIEEIPFYEELSILDLYGIAKAIHELSPMQRRVLVTAYKKGYFDYPRRIKSKDISSYIGISKATLSQHIRRAEAKIYKPIIKLIQKHYR